jgi:hypothetical protein
MTLLIEHLIILLAEEVCGSWRFTVSMAAKYIIRCSDFLSSYRHIVCVISLRGLKKGKRSHARARMSARGSLG